MSNSSKYKKPFSWKERAKSFDFSFQGIFRFFREEHNARIHFVMSILALILSWILQCSKMEWAIIILCIVIVLTTEMINTAIERLADAAHPAQHPLIKACKDIASGAVLTASIGAVIIASIILLPKVWLFCQTL